MEGKAKTQVMYRATLSFKQLNDYLRLLLHANLLEKKIEGRTTLKTTEKGRSLKWKRPETWNHAKAHHPIHSRTYPLSISLIRLPGMSIPAIQHPNDGNPRNNIRTHRIPQKPTTKLKYNQISNVEQLHVSLIISENLKQIIAMLHDLLHLGELWWVSNA